MILFLVSPSVRRVINTAIVPVLLVLFFFFTLSHPYFYSVYFPYSILPGSLYTYHHCYYLSTGPDLPTINCFPPNTLSAAFSFPALFSFSTTSIFFL